MDIHYIELTAYSREGGKQAVEDSMDGLLPKDVEVSSEVLEGEMDGGVFHERLVKSKARIERQKDIKMFMNGFLQSFTDRDRQTLRKTVSHRVDEVANLYIRISKKHLEEGRCRLADSDSVHVRIKLAPFPVNPQTMLVKAKEVLK